MHRMFMETLLVFTFQCKSQFFMCLALGLFKSLMCLLLVRTFLDSSLHDNFVAPKWVQVFFNLSRSLVLLMLFCKVKLLQLFVAHLFAL